MKLLDLHLRAYGPFTDRHLDLSSGNEGLHIIFGPNETGKSSALRALRSFLYGIPERTTDAHKHDKATLRVGGVLRSPDGERIVCYRRKGRKNTLLDQNDEPIPDDTLTRLLGGVDAGMFEHLFGIDHEALVTGGQALLDERGREAEALFGTGLGSHTVHAVLEEFDQEAQLLFAPRASKPLINSELSQLAEIERQQREVSLSARKWDEARKAVNVARRSLKNLDAELVETTKRRDTLERIRRSLPGLARRVQIHEQLDPLKDVPELSDDFGSRREEAFSNRRLAVEARLKAQSLHKDVKERIADQVVDERLLAASDAVDDLREQLGSYRKAARDKPNLVAEKAALEEQARTGLAESRRDLSLDDVDDVRALIGERRRATELGGRREALLSASKRARDGVAEAEQKLESKRKELGDLSPTRSSERLRQAVEAARRAGEIDDMISETELRVQQQKEALSRELGALGLYSGAIDELLGAPFPSEETVQKFVEKFRALDERHRRAEQARLEASAEEKRAAESLRALRLSGPVPSEDDLDESRAHRDEGWQLLRQQWLDGADVEAEAQTYDSDKSLPDAFEEAINGADEIGDRLRREATRVHDQAVTQAKVEASQQAVQESEDALKKIAKERATLDTSWQDVWMPTGITPMSAQEMVGWLRRATRLREKASQIDESRKNLLSLNLAREGHLKSLREPLIDLDELKVDKKLGEKELRGTLSDAEECLRTLEDVERRRKTLMEDISELEDSIRKQSLEQKHADEEYEKWNLAWASMMRDFGLPEEADPGEVSDYLETIATTIKLVDEAKGIESRIEAIDTDASRFEQEAKNLVKRVANDLSEQPFIEAIPELQKRLDSQRESKIRLDELRGQMEKAEDDIRENEVIIQTSEEILSELCIQAGCEAAKDLEKIEQRHAERQRLLAQLKTIEIGLVESGDGLGIEELINEAETVDRDTVVGELESIKAQLERELRPKREDQLENKINAERDFEAMAGGNDAAVLAEEGQQAIARLRTLSERYVRFKLARRILRDEIERFRKQHRDPILNRAGGYFRKLTCGSLIAVETDFDEADQPVLVGVRPSGERLRVEAMSDGASDQLYLALRLATLDHYLDSSEPLPFVADDILVRFDDDRAQATLDALADFSAKTQVILFTHHRRDIDNVERLQNSKNRIFVHELG